MQYRRRGDGATPRGLVLVDLSAEEAERRYGGEGPEGQDDDGFEHDEPHGLRPLHCRLHLWHTWWQHHVPGGGTYVACRGCGTLMPEPLFARPWA